MTHPLLATLGFLCANVFFVLAEFSLVRTQTARLEVMKNQGRKRATLVFKMVRHLDRYLSAIQIGVTMSTLGLGWVGEPTVSKILISRLSMPDFLGPFSLIISTALAFLIIIYFQIVFAELVPRTIAINKAEKLALWLAWPLELYYQIFRLPTYLLSKSAIITVRLLGLKPAGEHEQVFSQEEMRVLLGTSQERGLLPLDRLLLIENLFDFGSLKVKDAMVWRDKIVYLSTANSWEQNLNIIRSHHFSRYPLANPDLENVVGLIHTKDLTAFTGSHPDLMAIKKRIGAVQDAEPLHPLLKTMSSQGVHMTLCMKGTRVTGLLTLEDILEEIVGEVHDEFDARDAWSLHQYMDPSLIELNLKHNPKDAVHDLAVRVKNLYSDIKTEAVEKAIHARESQLPTAIGKGVAVPHARLPQLTKSIVAVGRAPKSISFTTPDKTPVRLVFLILTPSTAPIEQLRILSRVATIIRNDTLRKQLLSAKTPEQFFDVIRSSEGIIAG